MAVGEVINFIAYTIAPAILITPLGALRVIVRWADWFEVSLPSRHYSFIFWLMASDCLNIWKWKHACSTHKLPNETLAVFTKSELRSLSLYCFKQLKVSLESPMSVFSISKFAVFVATLRCGVHHVSAQALFSEERLLPHVIFSYPTCLWCQSLSCHSHVV